MSDSTLKKTLQDMIDNSVECPFCRYSVTMHLEKVYDLDVNARGFAYVCENPSCMARGPIGKTPEEAHEKAFSLTRVSIRNIIRQIQMLTPDHDRGLLVDKYGTIMWQKGYEQNE